VEENLNLRKLDRNNLHASVRQCAPSIRFILFFIFSLSCFPQNLMLQAEVLPHQAFVSHLFSNNGFILAQPMISHS